MSDIECEEKNKEVYFIDDVWGIIKEFAGIYHITTQWHKIISKVGFTKLHKWFKENVMHKTSWNGMSYGGAESGKKRIMHYFMQKDRPFHAFKKKTKEQYIELNKLINSRGKKDFSIYKKGQEVIYYRGPLHYPWAQYEKCGIIQKVNKNSLTVKFYTLHEEGHWIRREQYPGFNIGHEVHDYNKEVFEEKATVIYSYFSADFELNSSKKPLLLKYYDSWRDHHISNFATSWYSNHEPNVTRRQVAWENATEYIIDDEGTFIVQVLQTTSN